MAGEQAVDINFEIKVSLKQFDMLLIGLNSLYAVFMYPSSRSKSFYFYYIIGLYLNFVFFQNKILAGMMDTPLNLSKKKKLKRLKSQGKLSRIHGASLNKSGRGNLSCK